MNFPYEDSFEVRILEFFRFLAFAMASAASVHPSEYMVTLRHLEKSKGLSGSVVDLIGVHLQLYLRDNWKVLEKDGLRYQFQTLALPSFQKTSWSLQGWQVPRAPAGSVLISGEVLEEDLALENPDVVIKHPLVTLQLYSPLPLASDSEDSELRSLDSAAHFPYLRGGVLNRDDIQINFELGEEEDREEDPEVENQELEQRSIRDLVETYDRISENS